MERSRSSARSSSGAVEIRLRIWLMAWVRLLRAEQRATRSTRMASTFPSLVLADPVASPPWAARAAATASCGVGLALAPAALAVGPVDFDHRDALGMQVPGESGPVAAGPFDADELEGPEGLQPAQQRPIARRSWSESSPRRAGHLARRGRPPRGRRGACRPLR